ncbi:HYR domain-containing protein [Corallococcus coralloides]|uniref:HYR domain-containing protein n=1 Tax=Corallococcus coralloides TaxID=184914 RepID=UPI00384E7671
MGIVSGRAWLSALSLAVGAAPAFARAEPAQMDPVSVRRLVDLTSTPQLLPDFNRPGAQATAELNGRLYFLATPGDGSAGPYVQDLWVTDGTPAGTRSVQEELLPSGARIDPGSLRATPHRLFFTATSAETGRELWTSDGTREGTHVTRELNPGRLDGVAFQAPVFVFGDSVLFAPAGMGETEFDLWKSDGTAEGTVPVKDIYPGLATANANGFARVGDTVFFSAETEQGFELWRTDGTEAGTALVRDIHTGVGDSLPRHLTAVGDTLYFTAEDSTHGRALWKSDGTGAGTVLVHGFKPTTTAGPSVHHLTAMGSSLLFLVTGTPEGIELWRTDGTEAGTLPVKTLPRSMLEGPPGVTLVPAGSRVFVVARGAASGDSLWVTDGTEAGTVHLSRPTAYGVESVRGFTPWEDGLAFIVTTQAGASELWRTDGTGAGTARLTWLPSGNLSALASGLVSLQGALLTTAGDPWTPRALWRMERDEAPPTFVCPATRDVPANRPEGTLTQGLAPVLTSALAATVRTTHPDSSLLPLHQPVLVTTRAEDATGRLAYCSTVMTSRDLTGPAINGCPTQLSLGTRSARGATFYYPTLNIQDESGSKVLVTYSPENGSMLPLGTTQVNMTAKDAAGNETTCAFPVTVFDGQAPTGACKVSEVRVEAEGPDGAHAYWPEPTPTDSISSKVTVTSTHASGDLFPLGLTRVQVVSTDDAGNSTSCEIQVRVRDSRPPVLTCPQDQTLTTAVMSGTRAAYPDATAADAVSGTEISYSPVVGTPLAPGLHAVQVTAIDAAGNAALCNFQVTVQYDPTSDMRQGMGCSVGSGPESAVGWAALVALAWTLSRRLKDGKPRA